LSCPRRKREGGMARKRLRGEGSADRATSPPSAAAPLRHFVTPLPDAGRGRSASFAAGSAMALSPTRGEAGVLLLPLAARWHFPPTRGEAGVLLLPLAARWHFPPTRGEASVRFEDRMA